VWFLATQPPATTFWILLFELAVFAVGFTLGLVSAIAIGSMSK
jgi:hypothetical protein